MPPRTKQPKTKSRSSIATLKCWKKIEREMRAMCDAELVWFVSALFYARPRRVRGLSAAVRSEMIRRGLIPPPNVSIQQGESHDKS